MFDWIRFFRRQGVHFVTRGPNTGAGQISIQCPWCGREDPSQHLSISLRGQGYRCWRRPRQHFGRSRARLIAALLNCSFEEAARLAGTEVPVIPEDEDFSAQLAKLLGTQSAVARPSGPLTLPKHIKPLRGPAGLAGPFWDYLLDRGLPPKWTCAAYNLHYATQGRERYRIVIPVYSATGQLLTWTARSIRKKEELRYQTCPVNPPYRGYDGPLARKAPSAIVLGLPVILRATNTQMLVICEGPFDAIKVSALGHRRGVYGACLFGLDITQAQAMVIEWLAARFERVVSVLDPDAATLSLRIASAVTCPVITGELPLGVEDPGALDIDTFEQFMQQYEGGVNYGEAEPERGRPLLR